MEKWTLIETTKNYRVYKYNGLLTKFPNKSFHLKQEIEYNNERINPKYELISDLSKGVEYIIISDAHTHIERLVFAGAKFKDKTTEDVLYGHVSMNQISGRQTMMIYGGNPNDVFDDKVYLRQLQMLNKGE